MIIPAESEFEKEIKKIKSPNVKEKLRLLYDHIIEKKCLENADVIAEEVIAELFPNTFTEDIMIPFKFHKSIIGSIVFSVIYNTEIYYTMTDLIELTKTDEKPKGFSRQYLNQEIKAKRLQSIRSGGRWLFTKKNINDYLKSKGFKEIK